MVIATSRPLYPRERDQVPILRGAGWLSGAVWTAAENLAHPGIRSPDRQAGSESHTPTELSQPKGHVQNHYEHT